MCCLKEQYFNGTLGVTECGRRWGREIQGVGGGEGSRLSLEHAFDNGDFIILGIITENCTTVNHRLENRNTAQYPTSSTHRSALSPVHSTEEPIPKCQ